MLILVTCFTVVAVVISFVFMRYTIEEKRGIIRRCSENVVDYLATEGATSGKDGFERVINRKYDSIKSFISGISFLDDELLIFICDTKGSIVNNSEVPYGTFKDDIPAQVVQDINSSKAMTRVDLSTVFIDEYLCYATPLHTGKGNTVGSVMVCTSSAAMSRMVNTVVRIIVFATLLGLIVALVAVYFISKRISAPLHEMSKAAKNFANGNFEERVPVRGHDEVAKLAVAFNNMADKLSDVENQRRSFLSNIAHDLRTPMTTISGFIDAILDGAIPPEKYDHYLATIGSEVKRLSRLVSLLLDITRIEAGARKFNFESVDICEIARQIFISNEQRLKDKKLDVEFECDDDNMYVKADRDAVHQCLYNLCDNAVKFSREGGKYRVSVKNIEHKIYVSVFNEGIGIEESELSNVFDRFYKSDKSRGLDKSGLGLGLYIVKTIINAHGGEIWVKSRYGENCEFVFTLLPAEKKSREQRGESR